MIYQKILKGKFLSRPNRFIAHVEINGKEEIVHVKNTGRCKELLLPDSTVILEDFRTSDTRKTKFDLIAVYKTYPENPEKPAVLINMDSQAPNKAVLEWLKSQKPEDAFYFNKIIPEYTYGNSRIDFYMEKDNKKYLMEVKGCTLEFDGMGYFPDAPTERGVKHLYELTEAQKQGFQCTIAFVIQIPGIKEVKPNIQTHPEFGTALDYAKKNGVQILFLQCNVKEDELHITKANYL